MAVSKGFVELAAELALDELFERAELPAALREAAATYIDRRGRAATIAEALVDVDQSCLTTALLAADADLGLSDAWLPLSERLTMAGGLTAGDAERLRAVRLAGLVPGERSAYRGGSRASDRGSGSGGEALIGIAVLTSFSREGAIIGVRVALGGVSPHPLRARQVEAALRGRRTSAELIAVAVETAVHEAQPAGVGSLTAESDLAVVRAVTLEALRATLQ